MPTKEKKLKKKNTKLSEQFQHQEKHRDGGKINTPSTHIHDP